VNYKTLLSLASLLVCGLTILDAQINTNNSVVRFRFTYGTTRFGEDVDVELFDQDKPVTVSNFLAYVQTRRYDNSFLHWLAPDSFVQGGFYTVQNPRTSLPFQSAASIPSFGSITNEFNVGTVRSNVSGTLAMAKGDSNPNSATSSWFFNLHDNSATLDNQNGGYTVFGRVKTGQATLNAFNAFRENSGIVNTTNATYSSLCLPIFLADNHQPLGFPALPVAFAPGQICVGYSDLFAVQIIQLSGRDVVGPIITVRAPKANATLTNATLLVNGTATDNVGVKLVRVYLNDNVPVLATGSNTWSAVLTNLPPGTNSIQVEALDTSGNPSVLALSVFYSVRVPLSLSVVGAGTIAGATDQQLLEVTRPYTLTAKPAPGNLFVAWTGSIAQAATTLKFNMASNFAFTAVFATNLFPQVRCVYNGLFFDSNLVDLASAGFVTVTLTDQGKYSGRLLRNGRTIRLSGVCSPDGNETNTVTLAPTETAQLLFSVDLSGATDQIVGSLQNTNFTSQLLMDRNVFALSKTNPAPWAGRYTMLIQPDTNSAPGPDGQGFASVRIDPKGGVAVSGTLGDNTKLSAKTTLSKSGAVPLYGSLYKGWGLFISWLNLDTNAPDTDFAGRLDWLRRTQPGTSASVPKFTNQVTAIGSWYQIPTTNRVLSVTNVVVGFTNGNLASPFANQVLLGADNKFVNQSTNKLTLTIAKSTGLFKGSVAPPGSTRSLPFQGALFQKQNRGAGFLVNTGQTSEVSLGQ